MKIALLIDSLVRGGAERQVICTFQEFRRRGIDVRIIYYHQCPHEFEIAPADADKVVLISKSGRPLRFIRHLRRYFNHERFDIVHAFKDTPCFYGCLAAWLGPTRVFVAGHRTQVLPVGRFRHAFNLVNRLCTAWIGNSLATARTLTDGMGTVPARVFTVYNGIDSAGFASALSREQARKKFDIPPDQQVVSIIAVIRPEKNHSMFVRMAARVADQNPKVTFLVAGCPIAGDTASQSALEALAKDLGIDSRIRFLGMREDVPDLLAATDVLVLTSHQEGMANALLEAMAAGIPFVTTNYAGVDELVQNGVEGSVVPIDDHDAMARTVVQLLSDNHLRARMGAAGRATVASRFSVHAMADNLLRIYQQLLNKGVQPGRAADC